MRNSKLFFHANTAEFPSRPKDASIKAAHIKGRHALRMHWGTKFTYRCHVDQSNGEGDHYYGEGENFAGVLSLFEERTELVHEASDHAF